MTFISRTLSAVVIGGGLAAGLLGFGAASAGADPVPPPPAQAEQPPAWAPPKPAEVWVGQPVVWTSMWGGRWGVWINDGFITLTSNPVTNGG